VHYKSQSYTIFTVCNNVLLALLGILCIMPVIHILAVSFSGQAPASANLVGLLPIDFTLDAWAKTIDNEKFLRSLWNGVFRTVLGTVVIMGSLTLAAYSLSKEEHEFKGRTFYIYFFVIIMIFHSGLIPQYLLVTGLGLKNTVWALVFTNAVNVFNLILLLNFFRTGVPKALEEASFIDGANHFRTLISVYLPLSLPAIATISLFTMVGQWNSWFDGIIYISDSDKYPLASFLQTIIVQRDYSDLNVDPDDLKNMSERTVRSAQIFIGALPILIVYPLLQKYFVKGMVLGSVKE
jgi:putative aldouronate transport system permease protein